MSSINRQAVAGSLFSVASSAITILLGALRAYLMVYWIEPAAFGIVILALFYVNLAAQLSEFGLASAYLHDQHEDEKTRRVFFTLNLTLDGASLIAVALLAPWIARFYPDFPGLALVMVVLALGMILRIANQTQTTILARSMRFKSIAGLDMISSIAMTLTGPALAWFGFGVWAIVGEILSGIFARLLALQLVVRPWALRLGWDPAIIRRFWEFGRRMWIGANTAFLIDHFDDLWVGSALGKISLGYYSRAYEFAHYPRRVIANPILSVFQPAFARLQDDRLRLSQAFFRSASLMTRTGGLFALLFTLTAPETFRLFLPERWLPMLPAFQWMILYSFLDPLASAAINLLLAAGRPGEVARIRLIQLASFVPAVIVLGGRGGITGVAIAADLMILIGTVLLYRKTRQVADYNSRSLWFWPTLTGGAIAAIVLAAGPLWEEWGLWLSLAGKLALIPLVYAGVLWLAEREQILRGVELIRSLLPNRFFRRDDGFGQR